MNDPFNLERFVTAQRGVYDQACAELSAGRKQSHWMWFVFPQLRGLGRSELAQLYGIASGSEAEAYFRHPLLGQRLRDCARLVGDVEGRTIEQIFGYPDNLKFHSCMTLFALVVPDGAEFGGALQKYFAGKLNDATIELLDRKAGLVDTF